MVFIDLKELVGSNLRALKSFMEEEKKVLIASVLGFGKRYDVFEVF